MKRRIKLVGGAVVLYVCSYLALSVSGGYEPSKSGKYSRFGLPTHDIYIWQLRYGLDSPLHGRVSFFSVVYAPLLWADRTFWHRELPMLRQDETGQVVDCPPPPLGKLHPRLHKGIAVVESYAERRMIVEATQTREDDIELDEEMLKALSAIYE